MLTNSATVGDNVSMVSIKIIANINILINKNIQEHVVGTAVAEERIVDL